jgi:hypothetical protein
MVQRLSDVGHEILHVLKTDGQTKQTVADPVAPALVGRVGGVGHASGMLNQGFGVAEAHRTDDQLEPVHEGHAGLDAALELKRNEPARLLHLALRKLVLRKRLEAGISDLGHERVALEQFRNLLSGA